MPEPEPTSVPDPPRAAVRRLDDRLGLPVARLPLSGRTLVNYTRDHVAVRTPSRPHDAMGNALDLLQTPQPQDLTRWVARFEETAGRLGARRATLRWEQPLTPDAVGPEGPSPALRAAAEEQGLRLTTSMVLLLDRLEEPRPAPVTLVPVEPPTVEDPAVGRRWHAATVLYRYATGSTPEEWREVDDDLVAHRIEVQRELAAAGRAQVWIALRHGAPVARLTLLHDRQGLAGVHDLVVHPVHRRAGIGAALTHAAVAAHLASHPGDRVGVEVAPGGDAESIARRLGLIPHATIVTAHGAGPERGGG
jgi:GNAT superfamily N-acetyltransferase